MSDNASSVPPGATWNHGCEQMLQAIAVMREHEGELDKVARDELRWMEKRLRRMREQPATSIAGAPAGTRAVRRRKDESREECAQREPR